MTLCRKANRGILVTQCQLQPAARASPSSEARERILAAARRLLVERPFADLTVDALMAEAGLKRTIFYRHYRDLPQLAPDLLPDAGDPLIGRIERSSASAPRTSCARCSRASSRCSPSTARCCARSTPPAAQTRPSPPASTPPSKARAACSTRLLAAAPHPPPDPAESARLMMAAHRAYLLDTFGDGNPRRGARRRATEALEAIWERLLS